MLVIPSVRDCDHVGVTTHATDGRDPKGPRREHIVLRRPQHVEHPEPTRNRGTLVIVSLARSRSPRDFAFDAAGLISTRIHRLTTNYWEHSAPMVWPPPLTFRATRAEAERVLPGVHFRRLVLFRYSLTWTKPA